MKRYLISVVTVLVVLVVALGAFAQDRERAGQGAQLQNMRQRWQDYSEEERRQFLARGHETQLKAIKSLQELVSQLKAVVHLEPRVPFREPSEEEAKLINKMAKASLEQHRTLRAIEEQLAKLRGPRQLSAGRQPSIGELRVIHGLAIKEKATQTARRLERLIARYQREPGGGRQREPQRRPERLERPQRERPARPGRDVEGERSGKRAPAFELNSFDGKTVSLSDYRGKIVVLEWFNFECPLSRYHYETKNTMVELANKYKGKNVVWLAVNSTNHTTPAVNKAFTKQYRLPYLILDDRSGKVGRAYGAQTTPHMYIINPRGNLVYEGAIDNNRRIDPKKKGVINYVDNALTELTARKAVSTPKTKPYGCTVKYAKK